MTSDVARLEKMMEVMSSGNANDPEMEQIGDVLDKILQIQHPERVSDKIREESLLHKQQVFEVQVVVEDNNISSMDSQPVITQQDTIQNQVYSVAAYSNSFYGLDGEESITPESSNAIEAVIHETQTVVAGSTIRMRLLSDVYINGALVEKDQFIYGKCAINGDRLTVSINSVRDEKSLLPVALSVYDLDGMEGISIPGAITRDAAKQAGSQSIQDVELYSMNNSLGVQAATAGIEAAKGLFTKKVKLIKVTVKAGYNILLKDNNQKNI
jgi:conjugative transposon TraM protein